LPEPAKVFLFAALPVRGKGRSQPGAALFNSAKRGINMPQSRIRRYLRHGTLPQLSVFEAVVRLGSFTRAAEELHMAQPTVSVQIKKLTETAGVPLLEQIGKRIHVTEPGRVLLAACDDIFQALMRIEDRFASIRTLDSGRLRLAVSSTGSYFASRMLAAFGQQHPGIDVALQIHQRQALLARLADNSDDLYIFATPPRDGDVVVQQIMPNPLVVFARADHSLAGQRGISLVRLAQEPFLIREPGSGTRTAAQDIFARHGLQPRLRMELSSNEAIKQAILAGLGVSILSRHTLGPDSEEKQLVTLDVEGFPLERYWYFVYPVGKNLPATAQAFMEFTRCHARQLALEDTPEAANRNAGQFPAVASRLTAPPVP
jgi:DNA-binding transcriptional LysR family regulator